MSGSMSGMWRRSNGGGIGRCHAGGDDRRALTTATAPHLDSTVQRRPVVGDQGQRCVVERSLEPAPTAIDRRSRLLVLRLCAAQLAAVLIGALAPPSRAQDPSPAEDRTKPRIGLVLSGGGARGAAHILGPLLHEDDFPVVVAYAQGVGHSHEMYMNILRGDFFRLTGQVAQQADAVDVVLVGATMAFHALLQVFDGGLVAGEFEEGRQPVVMLDDLVGDGSLA